ncbi:HNH endonuclease [Roseibium sp.]|uniref:HNH endonuclease n=1 Tax=Roseibium sp. TaxID=1936156 RepID=UPI003BB20940
MNPAIFYYKPDSPYDDIKGVQHHFPKRYLKTVEQALGDWIVYYGPISRLPSRYYTAIAKLVDIREDTRTPDHFFATLEGCLDFDRPLEYTELGGYETGFIMDDGRPNGGIAVNAIRALSNADFRKIIENGFSETEEWPARNDEPEGRKPQVFFSDNEQSPITGFPTDRKILTQIINRPFRDAKFRQHIRKLYDRTCAFTGLRLINGKGRPEVEAAHIIPVECGGNDSVQNGLALSGTVHWMFDRGLLSLSDEFDILASRQLNYDVSHLLNRDMKAILPNDTSSRPHPHYLHWHRTNRFKN